MGKEQGVEYAKLKGKRVWQTVTNFRGVCKRKGREKKRERAGKQREEKGEKKER